MTKEEVLFFEEHLRAMLLYVTSRKINDERDEAKVLHFRRSFSVLSNEVENRAAAPPDPKEVQKTKDRKDSKKLHSGKTLSEEKKQMIINIPHISIIEKRRKDGRFQGYDARSGKRKYFYAKTLDELYKKAIELAFPKKKKSPAHTGELTFKQWTETFFELYKKKKYKASTADNFKNYTTRPLSVFGDRALKSITTEELQDFLNNLDKKNASRARELTLFYMRQIFHKAYITKKIPYDPTEAVELERRVKERIPAFTVEQTKMIYEEIYGNKYEPLFILLFSSGLRIGEALALTSDDIDRERGTITVNKNVVFIRGETILQDSPKTNAGIRTIPVPANCLDRLPNVTNGERIFPYTYNQVKLYIDRLSKRLGFKITAHRFRHTYATRMEEAQIPAKIIQALLGHSDIRTTQQVYIDTQEEYIRSQIPRINDALTRLTPEKNKKDK